MAQWRTISAAAPQSGAAVADHVVAYHSGWQMATERRGGSAERHEPPMLRA